MRDPRTDPRAGDCLRKGDTERVFAHYDAGWDGRTLAVYWENGSHHPDRVLLKSWQSWSRDAEIVRVGDASK